MSGFWSKWFRTGLYDQLMPVNYSYSVGEAFRLLSPGKGAHIADFGCGNGYLLVYAADWIRNTGTLEGFDIDEEGVASAGARAQRLGLQRAFFKKADLCNLNITTPFDGAIAHYSLYTISQPSDRMKALAQMVKALKPGAKFVLSVPSEHYKISSIILDAKNLEDDRTDIPWFLRTFRKNVLYRVTEKAMLQIEKKLDEKVFHRFTAEELAENLKNSGLKVDQIIPSYGGCGYHAVAYKSP